MCHNAELVVCPEEIPSLSEDEVWSFLERRAGLVDGVVISGGEPTLQSDLASFLRRLREMGLDVKLDTNGYRPQVLEKLSDQGLVDYVAMDVKAPPDKYPLLAGRSSVDVERIESSIRLLHSSGCCEFRTTVVPGMLDEIDIEGVARWIEGAERYVLQQFRPQGTLDADLQDTKPYPMERLEGMAARAEHWVKQVLVRG